MAADGGDVDVQVETTIGAEVGLTYTYEVVELVHGERLVMQTASGPFPMQTTYTWASSDEGTRMTLRNRGRPSGFARVARPLLEYAMRRATRMDLRRLKDILETR